MFVFAKGWTGLTKDFNELTGPYDEEMETCTIDVMTYLDDAVTHRGKIVDYEETPEVLEALINWLNKHKTMVVLASVN